MSNITICNNETCKSKNTCHRYNATPNKYQQSYTKFEPNKKGLCDYYKSITTNRIVKN